MKKILITGSYFQEILESLNGIQRAKAPPFLYGKIFSKLSRPKNSTRYFNIRPAAAISILSFVITCDLIVLKSADNKKGQILDNNYVISLDDYINKTSFYLMQDDDYLSAL